MWFLSTPFGGEAGTALTISKIIFLPSSLPSRLNVITISLLFLMKSKDHSYSNKAHHWSLPDHVKPGWATNIYSFFFLSFLSEILHSVSFLIPVCQIKSNPNSPNSFTACSLERAKEDGSSIQWVPAGPCFCGNSVHHQRGVIRATDVPLCYYHL